jgi:creatinine amidohydrolase
MSGLPKRDWAEMTWQDFAGADTARWIAVLPLAAVEQHGPHLPLGTDAFIAEAYLARARPLIPADLPVTILPMQSIGHSEEHQRFPGTLTLSAETAIRAWTEIGESVRRAGIRKLVLMTSHGGNSPAMDIVARGLRARHDMLVVTCGWQRFGYPEGLFTAAEQTHGIHGGDIETSLMRAAKPQGVRPDKASNNIPATIGWQKEFRWLSASRPAGFGWMTQDLNASGAVGDSLKASAEKGETALEHGARAFVELLREIDRFDLDRLKAGPLEIE